MFVCFLKNALLWFCQASYESQQDILLMRFADYFGRAFALVSVSQFQWTKTFKESSVAKMVDVSFFHLEKGCSVLLYLIICRKKLSFV